MKASRVWLHELRRVVLLLSAAGLLGMAVNQVILSIALVLSAILAHWFYQLWRIQTWLSEPETTPPESSGIWGDIFDRIYHIRRKEHEAKRSLQSTVDYLRDSFGSMRDGTIMVDNRGAIGWSNEAAGPLLGLYFPKDRGQAILNLVRIPEFHRYFLAGDYTESLQLSIPGETELFLQIDISKFGDGDKLVFVRDVTRITRIEKMRRDFVGNVSHELRTPLTVISGYIDTILDNAESLEPRYLKPLQQMSQQSRRMESLLKDLLWLSRIESVGNVDKHDVVNVNALLEELRDELASTRPGRSIELDLACKANVLGDYRELHSAVSNLLLNAIKYSGDESVVKVAWRMEGDECLLSVRDSGQGIAAVHLPRLTERFYRVDDSRSSATGGTGLGLAIVKHVALSHNAQLNIESVPGVGSCFTLVFPCTTLAGKAEVEGEPADM